MIINSDERQWTWLDEGLNTFVQYLAEQDLIIITSHGLVRIKLQVI